MLVHWLTPCNLELRLQLMFFGLKLLFMLKKIAHHAEQRVEQRQPKRIK
jgi:hypothetical protein